MFVHPTFKIVCLSLLLFAATALAPDLSGQAATGEERKALLREAQRDAEQYISILRPKLFDDLQGKEAKIYRQIQFRVSDEDADWRAGSMKVDGSRLIEIDVGYVRKVEMLAEAVVLEEALDKPILVPYIRYVAISKHNSVSGPLFL
jgi:hypothetical protein